MTPPPSPSMSPVDQITLVCDYPAGNVILVRFPGGLDLAPAALIARLAAAGDCAAALGAARADAAELRVSVERLSAERRTGDGEEIAALRAEVAALRSALQRFVVPGHCDEVRRGVAQCGGVCRWCEAARALEGMKEDEG